MAIIQIVGALPMWKTLSGHWQDNRRIRSSRWTPVYQRADHGLILYDGKSLSHSYRGDWQSEHFMDYPSAVRRVVSRGLIIHTGVGAAQELRGRKIR